MNGDHKIQRPKAGQLYRVKKNPDDMRFGGGICFDYKLTDDSDSGEGGRWRLDPGSIFMLVKVEYVQPVWSRFTPTEMFFKLDILYQEKVFEGVLMHGEPKMWDKNFDLVTLESIVKEEL